MGLVYWLVFSKEWHKWNEVFHWRNHSLITHENYSQITSHLFHVYEKGKNSKFQEVVHAVSAWCGKLCQESAVSTTCCATCSWRFIEHGCLENPAFATIGNIHIWSAHWFSSKLRDQLPNRRHCPPWPTCQVCQNLRGFLKYPRNHISAVSCIHTYIESSTRLPRDISFWILKSSCTFNTTYATFKYIDCPFPAYCSLWSHYLHWLTYSLEAARSISDPRVEAAMTTAASKHSWHSCRKLTTHRKPIKT